MAQTYSPLQRVLILLVKAYQKGISPLFGPCCRFSPTCSYYTIQAISEHGALFGCWLAIRRILKCHPLHPGGNDPVPSAKQGREE